MIGDLNCRVLTVRSPWHNERDWKLMAEENIAAHQIANNLAERKCPFSFRSPSLAQIGGYTWIEHFLCWKLKLISPFWQKGTLHGPSPAISSWFALPPLISTSASDHSKKRKRKILFSRPYHIRKMFLIIFNFLYTSVFLHLWLDNLL